MKALYLFTVMLLHLLASTIDAKAQEKFEPEIMKKHGVKQVIVYYTPFSSVPWLVYEFDREGRLVKKRVFNTNRQMLKEIEHHYQGEQNKKSYFYTYKTEFNSNERDFKSSRKLTSLWKREFDDKGRVVKLTIYEGRNKKYREVEYFYRGPRLLNKTEYWHSSNQQTNQVFLYKNTPEPYKAELWKDEELLRETFYAYDVDGNLISEQKFSKTNGENLIYTYHDDGFPKQLEQLSDDYYAVTRFYYKMKGMIHKKVLKTNFSISFDEEGNVIKKKLDEEKENVYLFEYKYFE